MKNNVYIINTSRGPIIEEGALIEALNSKKLPLKDKSDFFSNSGSFHQNVTKLKNQ